MPKTTTQSTTRTWASLPALASSKTTLIAPTTGLTYTAGTATTTSSSTITPRTTNSTTTSTAAAAATVSSASTTTSSSLLNSTSYFKRRWGDDSRSPSPTPRDRQASPSPALSSSKPNSATETDGEWHSVTGKPREATRKVSSSAASDNMRSRKSNDFPRTSERSTKAGGSSSSGPQDVRRERNASRGDKSPRRKPEVQYTRHLSSSQSEKAHLTTTASTSSSFSIVDVPISSSVANPWRSLGNNKRPEGLVREPSLPSATRGRNRPETGNTEGFGHADNPALSNRAERWNKSENDVSGSRRNHWNSGDQERNKGNFNRALTSPDHARSGALDHRENLKENNHARGTADTINTENGGRWGNDSHRSNFGGVSNIENARSHESKKTDDAGQSESSQAVEDDDGGGQEWEVVKSKSVKNAVKSVIPTADSKFVPKLSKGGTEAGYQKFEPLVRKLHQPSPNVTSISLVGEGVNDACLRSLSEGLKHNKSVTTLDLGNNPFTSRGLLSLAKSLKRNTTLTHLGLSRGQWGEEGGAYLARLLREGGCSRLKTLDLTGSKLGSHGTQELLSTFAQNPQLQLKVTVSERQAEFVQARLTNISQLQHLKTSALPSSSSQVADSSAAESVTSSHLRSPESKGVSLDSFSSSTGTSPPKLSQAA